MVIWDWQQQILDIFAGMYSAKTLNEGEQIIFAMDGLTDDTAYIVLRAGKYAQTLTLCMDRRSLADYAALIVSQQKRVDKLKIAGQMLEQSFLRCHAGSIDEEPLREYMMQFDHMKDIPGGNVLLRRWRAGYLPDSELSGQEVRLMMAALKTVFEHFEQGGTVQTAAELLKQSGKIRCLNWKSGEDADGSDDEPLEWRNIDLNEHTQVEFISPRLEDELLTRRLIKKPVSDARLYCSVRSLPIPLSEEPVRTPVMMGMIDEQRGVVATEIIQDYEEEYSTFATAFVSYVEDCGRPVCVTVDDLRTYSLLRALCEQIRVPIAQAESLPQMDELFHAYLEMVCSGMLQQMEEENKDALLEMETSNGQGVCMICGKVVDAQNAKEHIAACLQEEVPESEEDNLLLRISDVDDADYWMYAALKRDAALAQLDNFLRDVWVDCCGHMSVFTAGGEEYYSSNAREMGGHSMKARIFKDISCGAEILYEYDFGTPTRLKIEVIAECKMPKRQKKAVQLARNIQPKYACICCGRRAEYVASRMGESIAESAYCAQCGLTNEEVRESLLPIVNSPRCGVCGYGAWMMHDDLFEDDDE